LAGRSRDNFSNGRRFFRRAVHIEDKNPIGIEDLLAEIAEGAGAFDFIGDFEKSVTIGAYRFHGDLPRQYSSGL